MRTMILRIGAASFAALATVALVIAFLSISPAVLAAEPLGVVCDPGTCTIAGQRCTTLGNGCMIVGFGRVDCYACCRCGLGDFGEWGCQFNGDELCLL